MEWYGVQILLTQYNYHKSCPPIFILSVNINLNNFAEFLKLSASVREQILY